MKRRDPDATIRDALHARADLVQPENLRPALPPTTADLRERMPRRWLMPSLVAAAAAAVVIATVVAINNGGSHNTVTPPLTQSPSPTVTTSAPSLSTTPPSSTAPTTSAPTTSSPGTFDLGYEPLWPFATYTAAEQWRTTAGGSQPWHADAGQTALSFTRGYLGFTETDRVISTSTDSTGAHVGVGYLNPAGQKHTTAVLHLVRFGRSADSPWEVVGTDDTDFSLEQPAYGATVSSPVSLGGHITGVDENIHVWARSLTGSAVVGEQCCTPAGGDNSPWSVQVPVQAHGVVTLVASTGGHTHQVERFAIQGVTVR